MEITGSLLLGSSEKRHAVWGSEKVLTLSSFSVEKQNSYFLFFFFFNLKILCPAYCLKISFATPSRKTFCPKWLSIFILACAALGTQHLSNGEDASSKYLLEMQLFPSFKTRGAHKSSESPSAFFAIFRFMSVCNR